MSKFTVPIRLADFNISFDSVQTGFKTFYLKNGSLKLNNGTEKDVVLDRKLDNFTPVLGVITNDDSVLTALEKMQYAIQSFSSFTCDDLLSCPIIENLIDGVAQLNTDLTALDVRLTNDENDILDLQNQIQNVLYSGDNISELVNDVGYITAASLPVQYLATEYVDSYIGNRLKPADASSNGFRFKKSINGSIGYAAINPNTGNGAVASIGVGINNTNNYVDNAYLAQFGPNYYVSQFAGKAGLMSSTKLFVGTYGTGDLDFVTGSTFTAMSSRFRILNSGELQIPTVPGTGTTSDFILLRNNTGTIKQISYPDFSGYVPYTGATQDVDLGLHSISTTFITDNSNVDYENSITLSGGYIVISSTDIVSGISNNLDINSNSTDSKKYISAPGVLINTSATEPIDAGKIVWNSADGTFDMGLLNGVTLQAGQEIHMYAKASGAISNGDAVQFAGAQGDHLLIKKAVPSEITANPEYFIGVATQDFAKNDFGYVTVFGQVRDLDTEIYPEGTVLYFDSMSASNGLLTSTRPTGPNAKIIVAAVVRSHQNQGSLFVRPHVMPKFGDLQNVEINTPEDGQIVAYDEANQVWTNIDIPDAPIPTLQQVTDEGNTTENEIILTSLDISSTISASELYIETPIKYSSFSTDGLTFGDSTGANYQTSILTRTRTQNTDFYFEDEGGSKSIATREWVDSNQPNLQEVTDSGNTTTNDIEVIDAGVYKSVLGNSQIYSENLETNERLTIVPNSIIMQDENGFGTNITDKPKTGNTTFYFEDEGGSKSIATREWTDDNKLSKSSGSTYTTNAILTVTQAEYDAIVTKDPTTLYFIV